LKTYKELKTFCANRIKDYPQYEKKYKREIIIAKRFYDNKRNLYEELRDSNKKISTRYVIPFLLGFTKKVTNEPFEYIQVKPGASGGVDCDCDFSTFSKAKVQEYLFDKYGKECVLHVGTYSKLGPASAAKDLLRIYKIDFKQSNEFTKVLDANKSWEENLGVIKESYPNKWKFYLDNKEVLDLTPYFINKVRQASKHAGGIVILPEPVYNYIPVDRVRGEIVTAFPESSQYQILDELGIVKFDILAITTLDVIRNTIDLIDEKLYLIEDNGIRKIVLESYIDKELEKF